MPTRQRSHRRRGNAVGLLASGLAALLLLALPAMAAAFGEDEYGTVTILDRDAEAEVIVDGEPRVCGFAFVFDLDTDDGVVPLVGWRVRTWAADPLDGDIVLSGDDGPTDEDGVLRQPRDGWFELPDGRYTVLWDDEDPPDRSAGVRTFTVECEEATPAPTEAPTATPTATPEASVDAETATPESSVGGETATPRGGVGNVGGDPNLTLPPTDTAAPGTETDARGSMLAVSVLAGLVATLFALRPRRGRTRR